MDSVRNPIILEIPKDLQYQLIYRLMTSDSPMPDWKPGEVWLWNHAGCSLIREARLWLTPLGCVGFIKALLKVLTGRRILYGVVVEGRIVSRGWVTWSPCKHYWVEKGAAVIGPVWTDTDFRGHGLAARALQAALAVLSCRGATVCYIDTSGQNVAMQRVIHKCGFGPPVGLHIRGTQAAQWPG